jgi:integrase
MWYNENAISGLSPQKEGVSMSEKRKDHKGRILRTGESQRKDLLYQYRYQDARGQRKTIYERDLTKLREREKELAKQVDDGVDYAAGKISAAELLERYVSLKRNVKPSTECFFRSIIRSIKKTDFGYMDVCNIKMSDAKKMCIDLSDMGLSFGTISRLHVVTKAAFRMAVEEDIIRKNPFSFPLSSVVRKTTVRREALSEAQQKVWLDFIKNDEIYSKYYDEYVVMLGTGVRVSELCGLTKKDLDFENRRIYITHQLQRDIHGVYHIYEPKSESGVRVIPMSDEVYESLKNILRNRKAPKTEMIIDGHSGFILINKFGNPKVAQNIEKAVALAQQRYDKLHPDAPLPHISPHVLRHTFCTNMVNGGMGVKSLQYLMGHANAKVTLDVYSHASSEQAEKEMLKIVNISDYSKRNVM